MSQTAVTDEPGQAYAGKVEHSGQFPNSIISLIAAELIYFGKLVVAPDADVEVGGASGGPQTCAAPTSAAEALLANTVGGVSIADPTVERMRDPSTPNVANSAPYGAYGDETSVSVMRKGRIWVQTEAAVAALSDGVFVRVANAGTIPVAALGSFTPTNTADHEPAPSGMVWSGATTIGGLFFGRLDINLPG
ncbi:MAG: hypothetical protein QGG14_06395 [Planctomycetota bacterium]|nr:hypothetical protein [Planctomycetota bacterium]|tara:strand:- start:145 stop:720 length:576 start_codon:yes stop_codon:yes gene_type:complete